MIICRCTGYIQHNVLNVLHFQNTVAEKCFKAKTAMLFGSFMKKNHKNYTPVPAGVSDCGNECENKQTLQYSE